MTRKELAAILEPFLELHSKELRDLCVEASWRLSKRFHPADALTYDNYNFVVCGWTFTGKPGDAFLSIAISKDHASICFLQGVLLMDPEKRLRGGGKLVRNVRLESLKTLDDPYISRLIDDAAANAKPGVCDGRAVLRSISERKVNRPKSPTAAKS